MVRHTGRKNNISDRVVGRNTTEEEWDIIDSFRYSYRSIAIHRKECSLCRAIPSPLQRLNMATLRRVGGDAANARQGKCKALVGNKARCQGKDVMEPSRHSHHRNLGFEKAGRVGDIRDRHGPRDYATKDDTECLSDTFR
nr:hypothetical protein CFP56_00968 [Quercus suber]